MKQTQDTLMDDAEGKFYILVARESMIILTKNQFQPDSIT